MNKSFTKWTQNQLQSITVEFDKKIRLLQEGLKQEHAAVINLKNKTVGTTNNIIREINTMTVEFDKKIILLGEKLQKEHATVVNLKNEMVETTNNITQETRDHLMSVSVKLDNNIDFVYYQLEAEIAVVTQRFKTEIGHVKHDLLSWELKQKVYFSAKIVYKAVFQEDIVFADVTTNIGNAYNNITGKFTAPYAGVYAFFSNIIAMEITTKCQITLEVNNKPRLYFTVSTDPQRGGANMLITHLDQGDRVGIYNDGCYVGFPRDAPGAHWNTFSGFLLHSEDNIVPVLYELSRISREDMLDVCAAK